MSNVYAVGHDELRRMPDLEDSEKCPSCGKSHRVVHALDKDGIPSDIHYVKCPKNGSTYLIGIKGKRIPYRKGKLHD